MQPRPELLGNYIDGNGIRTDHEESKTILDAQIRRNWKELTYFLGFA